MKWSPSFNFPSPHFRGDCHQVGDERHTSLQSTASFTLLSPYLLCFTPFSVSFLLLLLFMSPFEAEDWGKMKCWLSLSDQGSRYPPHRGLAAGEQMDPSNQGDKRSRQGGGVNPGVSGSSPALGKSKGNNGKSFFPHAEFTCVNGIPITLKRFCTVVRRI